MLMIEGIKQFVAWIGGAVAGLSILFYAAGYLVHRAHTNMLGLTGIIDFPHEQLLYEGAKFFFTVGAYLLKSFVVIGITLLIAGILLMLLRQIVWLDRAGRAVTTWVRARRDRLNERHPALLGACALALLAGVFVVHTDRFLYPLQDLYTRMEHLLYRSPPANPPAGCGIPEPAGATDADGTLVAVTHWLQQGEKCRDRLLGEFRRLLAGYFLLLIALGYFALPRQTQEPSLVYRIAIGTLATYGVLYTLLLPMAFGVLVRSPIYPVITLKSRAGAVDISSPVHLLNKNDRSLLVWDRAVRKATWLPADAATQIDVHRQANLFALPAQEGAEP